MREIIFHAGTPKTGSSALQVFLARNHDKLLAGGLDYFMIGDFSLGTAGSISSGNGSLVSRSVLPSGNPIGLADGEPHISAFLAAIEASRCERGLISSELFADADPLALARLVERVTQNGMTAKAFFYVRRQDQFLSSAYMQQVKRHQCIDYPEVYVRKIYRQVKYLRYLSFFNTMSGIFGNGNVVVRVYDRAVSAKSGLLSVFLQALNIDEAGLDLDVKDINTSLTSKSLLMMLMLNKYKPRMNFSDALVQNEITSGAMQSGMQHNLFSDTLAAEIDAYFREENAGLATAYFHRQDLFDPTEPAGNAHSISRLSLSAEDAVAFLGGLLVQIEARLATVESMLKSSKDSPN